MSKSNSNPEPSIRVTQPGKGGGAAPLGDHAAHAAKWKRVTKDLSRKT